MRKGAEIVSGGHPQTPSKEALPLWTTFFSTMQDGIASRKSILNDAEGLAMTMWEQLTNTAMLSWGQPIGPKNCHRTPDLGFRL